MQIQTELDTDRTKKLTFIQQQTHQDTKEIIEAAIDIYYQNVNYKSPSQAAIGNLVN
jgi:hypothetical protein